MNQERLNIWGVPFDKVTFEQALEIMEQAIRKGKKQMVVTPNPEICLTARGDEKFRRILSAADLSVADGFGILWASRYLAGKRGFWPWLWTLLTPWQTKRLSPLPERVTGTDLMREFCRQHKKCRIFLLGASSLVNDKLRRKLKNSGVNVVGNYSGDDSKKLEDIICSMINSTEAEVLFVAFGAPKQESWLARNLPKLKTVRLAMGIGGAFDFLVGERRRAPAWMRSVGLEWLYRLLIEPKRIKRIWNAVVIFPLKVYLGIRR